VQSIEQTPTVFFKVRVPKHTGIIQNGDLGFVQHQNGVRITVRRKKPVHEAEECPGSGTQQIQCEVTMIDRQRSTYPSTSRGEPLT